MFELTQIQNEIKAPKGQLNKFGNYNYRSCEDIQQALKPLLLKYKCAIIIADELVMVGNSYNKYEVSKDCTDTVEGSRYYVKATVTFYDPSGKSIQVTASAREESQKKGMSASQITGSASSYARKYALSGLLLLDDTKDADSFDNK